MSRPTEPVQVTQTDKIAAHELALLCDRKFHSLTFEDCAAQALAAHRVAAERAALQMAARIARKPRILDAMKGVVATPDFGEEIAVEIEACPTVSAAQTGEK